MKLCSVKNIDVQLDVVTLNYIEVTSSEVDNIGETMSKEEGSELTVSGMESPGMAALGV